MNVSLLRVPFESPETFLNAYETEVAHGGLLVRGHYAGLASGAGCTVRLEVPGQAEIDLPARVEAVARFGVSVVFEHEPASLRILADRLRSMGARPTPPSVSRLTPAGARVVPAAVTPPPTPIISAPPPAVRSAMANAPTRPSVFQPPRVVAAEAPVAEPVSSAPVKPVAPAPSGTLADKLALLTPGQKMSAALSGERDVRIALLRDQNKAVHSYVLRNPRIGLDEVTWAAKLTTISPDALKVIVEHKEWGANPTILAGLVRNPKLPVSVAIRLLPKIASNELRAIAKGGARDQIVQAARKMIAG